VARASTAATAHTWWRHALSPVGLQRILGTAAAAALGLDSYVHLHDAGFYDAVKTSVISQGTLFRVQGALAAAIGLALLVRPSRLWWSVAFIVAVSAFGAVMLYRYVDVGPSGRFPTCTSPPGPRPANSPPPGPKAPPPSSPPPAS
jgi:hypothetical protein